MPLDDTTVTLTNLAGGAAVELFQKELDAVLRNIADPNTNAESVREIVLKVRIKPNGERDVGDVALACSSKLGMVRGARTAIYFGKIHGALAAVEHNPKQAGLFDQRTQPTAVTPIKQKEGGAP